MKNQAFGEFSFLYFSRQLKQIKDSPKDQDETRNETRAPFGEEPDLMFHVFKLYLNCFWGDKMDLIDQKA